MQTLFGGPRCALHFSSAIASIVLLLLVHLAQSQTFYISKDGSNQNLGTSEGTAWRTWNHACENVGIGQTLVVMDDLNFNVSCTFHGNLRSLSPSYITLSERIVFDSSTHIELSSFLVLPGGQILFQAGANVSSSSFELQDITSSVFLADSSLVIFDRVQLNGAAGAEPVISIVATSLTSISSTFTASSGTGSAIYAKLSPQVRLEQSTFEGWTSAVRLEDSGLVSSHSTFRANFAPSTDFLGSAIRFQGAQHSLEILDSTLEANEGGIVVSVDEADSFVVDRCIFRSNSVPTSGPDFCVAIQALKTKEVTIDNTDFIENVFAKWFTTCIRNEVGEDRTLALIKNSTWSGNYGRNRDTAELWDMIGYSLLLENQVEAEFQDLDFSGENASFASVALFSSSALALPNNVRRYGLPISWAGFIMTCSNLTFQDDAEMPGRMILSRLAVCPTLNVIDLQGHSLTVIDPLDPSDSSRRMALSDNWMQTALFKNGLLNISSANTTVCCDVTADLEVESDIVSFQNVTMLANTHLAWGSSLTEFNLDSNSRLVIGRFGRLFQVRPSNSTQSTAFSLRKARVSGQVLVEGGTVHAAGLDISGDFALSDSSKLVLYPSNWRGVNHIFNVTGHATLDGTVQFSPDLVLDNYEPNLIRTSNGFNLQENAKVFIAGSVSGSPVFESLRGVDFGEPGAASDLTLLSLKPQAVQPTVKMSNDLSSVIVDWPIVMPYSEYPTSCVGLLDMGSDSSWDWNSISCVWPSPTRLVIYSARIPSSNDTIPQPPFLSSLHQRSQVQPPDVALAPVADFTFVPTCTGWILNADISPSVGSVPVNYIWDVSCTDSIGNDLCAALRAQLSNKPRIVLTGGVPLYPITFSLMIENYLGVQSAFKSFLFEPTTDVPQSAVFIEGPQSRFHTSNLPLILNARIDPRCIFPSTKYTWMNNSGEVLANTPSLLIPPWELAGITSLQLTVNASSSDGVSSTASISIFVSAPINRKFSSESRTSWTGADEFVVLKVEPPKSRDSGGGAAAPGLSGGEGAPLLWRLLQCADENAESLHKPIVSLNLTLPSEGRCRNAALGTTFDIDLSDFNGTSIQIPTSKLSDGTYAVQVIKGDLIFRGVRTPVGGLENADSLTLYFDFKRSSPSLSTYIVAPNPNALCSSQKIALKIVALQEDKDISGAAFDQRFTVSWSFRSSKFTIDPSASTRPYLIVPRGFLESGELIVDALVTDRLDIARSANASTTLSLTPGPTGGLILPPTISSDYSRISITTYGWTSQAQLPYLTYQFRMVLPGVSKTEIILSDFVETPTIEAILPVTVDGSTVAEFILIVVAKDSLGRTSHITKSGSIGGPGSKRYTDEALTIPQTPSELLQTAVNLSDWKTANDAALLIFRDESGVYNTPEMIEELLNATTKLAPYLPDTDSSAASILDQLAFVISNIQELTPLQQELALETLRIVLNAEGSVFGSTSASSDSAMRSFIFAMSNLLSAPNTTTDSIADSATLMSLLAEQILSEMIPDEIPLHVQDGGRLGVSAAKVPIITGSLVEIPSSVQDGAVVSFRPTDVQDSGSNGYVGVQIVQYNGTFPVPPPSLEFQIVSDTRFTTPGSNGSSVDQGLTTTSRQTPNSALSPQPSGGPGGFRTTFNVPSTTLANEASCTQYSSQAGWTPSCSTSSTGSTVHCDCNSPAPLSLIFGQGDFNPTGKASKGVLRAGAIAAIATVSVIILLVVLFVLIVLFVPAAKKFVRPFVQRKWTGREATSA